jgi:hypothetical protein
MTRFDEIALRECERLEEYYRRVGVSYGLAKFVYETCVSEMSASKAFNVVVNGEGNARNIPGAIVVRASLEGNLVVFTVSNVRCTNRFAARFGTGDTVLSIEASGPTAAVTRAVPSDSSDDEVLDAVMTTIVELAFRSVQKPSAYRKNAVRPR